MSRGRALRIIASIWALVDRGFNVKIAQHVEDKSHPRATQGLQTSLEVLEGVGHDWQAVARLRRITVGLQVKIFEIQ